MLKRRRAVSVAIGQRGPELHAIQPSRVVGGRSLGVRNRVAGRHDVHAAGAKHGFLAKAVVVDDLALEQPRDRLQPHVRMRRDVHRHPLGKREGAEPIEEAPRSDHAAPPHRKRPRDTQRAERDLVVLVLVEPPLRRTQCDQ